MFPDIKRVFKPQVVAGFVKLEIVVVGNFADKEVIEMAGVGRVVAKAEDRLLEKGVIIRTNGCCQQRKLHENKNNQPPFFNNHSQNLKAGKDTICTNIGLIVQIETIQQTKISDNFR